MFVNSSGGGIEGERTNKEMDCVLRRRRKSGCPVSVGDHGRPLPIRKSQERARTPGKIPDASIDTS